MNRNNQSPLKRLTEEFAKEEARLREGGGKQGQERQKSYQRLTVRERLSQLLDGDAPWLELGLWAGYRMYQEWGEVPAAAVVTGIGVVSRRSCMIIANDATVKAGALFPQSVKKILRAQRIAYQCRLPILYLVDSAGVFLPLQEDIFPDEDDFGRIFRNNAILSAEGIPQYAAIMGNCIAGGGYLPVLCDKVLMTEGSGLYIAGPALVKAAIGQEVSTEELGGARMHAEKSGTVDFLEPNDATCIRRLRSLVDLLPLDRTAPVMPVSSQKQETNLYELVSIDSRQEYDVRVLLEAVVDRDTLQESKAEYGKTLVTAYAKMGGMPVGIIANQRSTSKSGSGELEIGGVIYPESADKAARFILDCNQMQLPLLFFQDVVGFMVGPRAEQAGIIRSGAKLINALSNSIVPKITVIVGNSFGAGHYALCGKAYDPQFIFAWPNAKYAVMGGDQAADTLFEVQKKAAEKRNEKWDKKKAEAIHEQLKQQYVEQMDIRYAAARGWIDAVLAPEETRATLIRCLQLVERRSEVGAQQRFHTGVIQT